MFINSSKTYLDVAGPIVLGSQAVKQVYAPLPYVPRGTHPVKLWVRAVNRKNPYLATPELRRGYMIPQVVVRDLAVDPRQGVCTENSTARRV